MSIVVQFMSGETHTLEIFDGYRIIHIKNEIASVMKVNRDLISISRRKDDGEFDILDNMDYVESEEQYYAFVGDEKDPPEYYMKFDPDTDFSFAGVFIVDDDGKEVYHIKKGSILHVQLSEEGWDSIRDILRQNRDWAEYKMSKEDVIRLFMSYAYGYRGTYDGLYDIDIDEDD
jgi:hypothetical protein